MLTISSRVISWSVEPDKLVEATEDEDKSRISRRVLVLGLPESLQLGDLSPVQAVVIPAEAEMARITFERTDASWPELFMNPMPEELAEAMEEVAYSTEAAPEVLFEMLPEAKVLSRSWS